MARRLCFALTLSLAALVVIAVATPNAYPRSLSYVLESPACRDHHRQLASAERTTIQGANDQCVDDLRRFVIAMPCATSLSQNSERRLSSEDGPFKGKLNCTFDMKHPLNVSDLSQGFVVDCKEIVKPYDYTWLWWTLGVIGALFVLWGLVELVKCAVPKRRRQQAIDRAEAKPVGGHPYALA